MATETTVPRIAVIGAGASGAFAALHLLRRQAAVEVHLIDARGRFGPGLAYSTTDPCHLLNVRAGRMGALDEEPGQFAAWLAGRSGNPADFADRFLPRGIYGDYLADLLSEAGRDSGRLVCHQARVERLDGAAGGLGLTLSNGLRLTADRIVLCLGNLPPDPLPVLAPIAADRRYFANPWDGEIDPGVGDLLAVGSGLTMVDLALTLERRQFGGRLFALSRHGLLPRPHAGPPGALPVLPPELAGLPLSRLTARLHRLSRESDWRSVIDAVRPHMQGWWQRLPASGRQRFLRHLHVWWDAHRHRMAPEAAERIAALRAAGRLVPLAGRLLRAEAGEDGLTIAWRRRGAAGEEVMTVTAAVNCTGPGGDIGQCRDPLLRGLLDAGRVRPDALGLGLEVDRSFRLKDRWGFPQDRLYAIGPLTRGGYWECTAVPEIRAQARRLADLLAEAGDGQEAADAAP